MALPILTAAFKAAQLLKKYSGVLPHMNNPRATAAFLGKSLKELRDTWEDADSGTLFTLYDSVEKVIEIKVFMHLTASNLGVETRGKAPGEVLGNIVSTLEAEGATGQIRQIKDTLQWSAEFFAKPEVKEIFGEANVEIKRPDLTKPAEYLAFGKSVVERVTQEAKRVHNVMNVAKNKHKKPGHKPGDPK